MRRFSCHAGRRCSQARPTQVTDPEQIKAGRILVDLTWDVFRGYKNYKPLSTTSSFAAPAGVGHLPEGKKARAMHVPLARQRPQARCCQHAPCAGMRHAPRACCSHGTRASPPACSVLPSALAEDGCRQGRGQAQLLQQQEMQKCAPYVSQAAQCFAACSSMCMPKCAAAHLCPGARGRRSAPMRPSSCAMRQRPRSCYAAC